MINKKIFYRFSQFLSFLLGIRIFGLSFFVFTLYISIFFLFKGEKMDFFLLLYDAKIHGIVLCSALSIAAGNIINQFYDLEKDRFQKPFTIRFNSFLKQRYFLYMYLFFNVLSLGLALYLSANIFLFFLVYQFFIWFYSHKISRWAGVNNLTYVLLTLYPFFGMLIYFKYFSIELLLMSFFLFLVLLMIDILKDILTHKIDYLFGYQTLVNLFGLKKTIKILSLLTGLNFFFALKLGLEMRAVDFYLSLYFGLSAVLCLIFFLFLTFRKFTKNKTLSWIGFWRFWIFVGVLFILFNGLHYKIIL